MYAMVLSSGTVRTLRISMEDNRPLRGTGMICMSYKFNRDCWVESTEERLFCCGGGGGQPGTGGKEAGGESALDVRRPGRTPGIKPVTIGEIIAGAESLFARWGDALRRDERIHGWIRRLEANLENSRRCMRDFGIFHACARCDAEAPEGSCCSSGLERKYGPVMLVINLLMGAQLPGRRMREDSCYFLGLNGCVLKVRHMLCIDYLCPELVNTVGRESLIRIQTTSGEEIESAFFLHEVVLERIRRFSQ